MKYEEKYKQALERARKLYNEAKANDYVSDMEDYEHIFPELRESEDERIKKEIIELVHFFYGSSTIYEHHVPEDDMIAWLEKQGEQKPKHFELKAGHWYICHRAYCCRADHLTVKEGERFMCEKDGVVKGFVIKDPEKYFKEVCAPAPIEDEQKTTDKVGPKFKIGDWITNGEYIWKVTDIKPLDYILQSQNGEVVDDTISYVDEEFHLWTIQDAKDGDVLFTTCDNINEMVFIYRGIEFDTTHCYFLYSKTNNECKTFNSVCSVKADIHPATKEQCGLLFQKMKEAGYEWNAEKKEFGKIEQGCYHNDGLYYAIDILEKTFGKVEGYQSDDGKIEHQNAIETVNSLYHKKPNVWSEEDEKMLDSIIDCIDGLIFIDSDQLNWLKSIKPNHWKPSEQNIKDLEWCADLVKDKMGVGFHRLQVFIDEIKKL